MNAFYYHDCDREYYSRPRRTTGNIKGLELEISDDEAYNILERLINENKIIDRDNTEMIGEQNYTIFIENDSTVYKELIFKASCNRTLLEGVRMLSENLHGKIYNHEQTSCHIHINNEYLYNNNIPRTEIMRATEFLLPILGDISGRNHDFEWCRPIVPISGTQKLFDRCSRIDEIYSDDYDCDHDDRYFSVNVTGDATTEIRIFSNYYNFDYNYIKMYIETVDFIMELAKEMKGKSYRTNYEKALMLTKNHFQKRKYKEIYEKHKLEKYFLSPEEQIKFYYNEILRKFNMKTEWFDDNCMHFNENDFLINFMRIIRDYHKEEFGEIKFSLNNFNYEQVFSELKNQIEEYISSL